MKSNPLPSDNNQCSRAQAIALLTALIHRPPVDTPLADGPDIDKIVASRLVAQVDGMREIVRRMRGTLPLYGNDMWRERRAVSEWADDIETQAHALQSAQAPTETKTRRKTHRPAGRK